MEPGRLPGATETAPFMSESGVGRWDRYVLAKGADFDAMLREHLARGDRHVSFILGKGFDPRMNVGLAKVLDAGGAGTRQATLIEFDEGPDSASQEYRARVETNVEGLNALLKDRAELVRRTVRMWSADNEKRRITARSAEATFSKTDCETPTDIIVDISSLPRTIFFPLVAKLLYLLDRIVASGKPCPNLVVLVSENPVLDSLIAEDGIDEDADYVHPFRGSAEREATATHPKVWLPILGEHQAVQLTRINELIHPDEICPVVPSPSLNPRRGDNLVQEYRDLLFDALRVEPRNFIHASELNPFEAYRQVRHAVIRYTKALKPLGGCRSVVTSVSSKLLSMASLLATYELKAAKYDVAIAQIECDGYKIADISALDNELHQTTTYALWLTGEFYAS